MKRVQLKISGKVQGVFYRAETRRKAQELGLKGYAKNNRDGSVTVVAVGEENVLKELEAWCGRGPDSSRVESVEAEYGPQKSDEEFEGFDIY